ncbi:MAG TPA: sialate O-acetylesterase [Acidobacteriaceae bacterium]|jgi:sialate O-acetylesterase|nr:sialate O-acetylesterase [Acidobacteriaceae bacterium]
MTKTPPITDLLRGLPRRAIFGGLAVLLCIAAVAPNAAAVTRLPHMLSDHAVLQRNRPIHIWGWDDPGTAVEVSFRKQHVTTRADDLGVWSVYLSPEPAGGPDTLSIHGSTQVTLQDILVGDVWFASGQSNMEIPLKGFPGSAVIKNAEQEIAGANQPRIRLLLFPTRASDYPLDDEPATWTECTPATATNFSAIAYFFGREIQSREHIPIGLIDSTWGGTPIGSWLSLDALAADSGFMPVFAARARFAAEQADLTAIEAEEQRDATEAKAQGKPAPQHPWHPYESSWEPAFLYNGMVAPATPYTIAGFLWYQGETDSGSQLTPQLYHRLFPAMIRDWRARWNEGDLPFLYVQISSFYSPYEDWGMIRDAQRQTLSVANTAMAVSLDVGERDNVHPPDKQTVAARLALAARAMVYGEHVPYAGPLVRSVMQVEGGLRIWFEHGEGLHTSGGAVRGFEIAGPNGAFQPADAVIEGDTVLVHSGGFAAPLRVRYAWASDTDANLYNDLDLPASTFQWPEPE